MCDATYWPGDHLEAASPVEASFWPIHPTLDRLLQFKSLIQPFTDKSWSGEEMCTTSASTNCYGHNPYDITFWATTVKSESGGYTSAYRSNQEVREALNVASYQMPYVYDNFDWEHCESSGYSFKQLVAERR